MRYTLEEVEDREASRAFHTDVLQRIRIELVTLERREDTLRGEPAALCGPLDVPCVGDDGVQSHGGRLKPAA